MTLRSLSFAALAVALLATPVLTQAANVAARSTATASTTKAKSSKPSSLVQERMTAQQKLTAAGDYSGPVDGKRSIAYVTALKSFQTQHHLRASGHLNKATLAAFSA